MKLLWLSPYPESRLESELQLVRHPQGKEHACSWIVNLLPEVRKQLDGEVHLIAVSPWIKKDQIIRKDGITFHVLKSGIPFLPRGFPSWLSLDSYFGFCFLRLKIAREIRRIQPDVIHAHGTESVNGLAGSAQKKIPCIISMQGVINELNKVCPSFRFRIAAFWERVTVRRATRFACRTHYDKGFVLSQNPSARIYNLPEAINPLFVQEKRVSPLEKKILFVGNFRRWKGIDVLLEAMVLVLKQVDDARLMIVGGGHASDVDALTALAIDLGIDAHVDFYGVKSAEEIVQLQKQSQIFVLPSRNDNSPNSLVEAMAAGMPVIATDVGGVSSMFENGESGILVPSENPAALALEMIRLLESEEERVRLGGNAFKLVRDRNDPPKVAQQTIAAYSDMIAEKSN